MGMGQNKSALIKHSEAQRKCPNDDWKRWGDGFDRHCPGKKMTQTAFSRAVFPNMTSNIALVARIFRIFHSPRDAYLSKNEFLTVMYILVHGTFEERTAFLFNLYDSRKKGYLNQRDLEQISTIMDMDVNVSRMLKDLFNEDDHWRGKNYGRVELYEFQEWARRNPNTKVVNWLDNLSPSKSSPPKKKKQVMNTPRTSFWKKPRVSAAVNLNLTEKEVTNLERYFHAMDKSSDFVDFDTFKEIMENKIPPDMVKILFNAFDRNEDGKIDAREFLVGFSTACRGTGAEQLQFCFRSFDMDKDGQLSRDEVLHMVKALWKISNLAQSLKETADSVPKDPTKNTEEGFNRLVDSIFKQHDIENDDKISFDGFCLWAETNSAAKEYIKAVTGFAWSEVGIRPGETSEQRDIILEDLTQDAERPMQVGDKFYLIDLAWWTRFCSFIELDWEPQITRTIGSGRQNSDRKVSDISIIEDSEQMDQPNMRRTISVGHPGHINNSSLLKASSTTDVSIHAEVLRENLKENRDFLLVRQTIWMKLLNWYSGGPTIERQVIPLGKKLRVELYPVVLQAQTKKTKKEKRNFEASFSRLAKVVDVREKFCIMIGLKANHTRLKLFNPATKMKEHLYYDENTTVADAELADGDILYLETLDPKTLEWESDEDIASAESSPGVTGHGLTGMVNLGNTCYFNAAFQCLTHIQPLNEYFKKRCFALEINKENVLGFNGEIALAFHHLTSSLEKAKMFGRVYPRKMKAKVEEKNDTFMGNQQHDAQELLAWVLDALHEDLCRIKQRKYTENHDSKGRPDYVVAKEFWENYLRRNQSVIVDLFCGQFKSSLNFACGRVNNTFDTYNVIELPLPKHSVRFVRFTVIFVEPSKPPIRYTIRVKDDERIENVREKLAGMSGVPPRRLMLVSLYSNLLHVSYLPIASARRLRNDDDYFAYEMPALDMTETAVEMPPFEVGQYFDVFRYEEWKTAKLAEIRYLTQLEFQHANRSSGRSARYGSSTYSRRYSSSRHSGGRTPPPAYNDAVKDGRAGRSDSKSSQTPRSEKSVTPREGSGSTVSPQKKRRVTKSKSAERAEAEAEEEEPELSKEEQYKRVLHEIEEMLVEEGPGFLDHAALNTKSQNVRQFFMKFTKTKEVDAKELKLAFPNHEDAKKILITLKHFKETEVERGQRIQEKQREKDKADKNKACFGVFHYESNLRKIYEITVQRGSKQLQPPNTKNAYARERKRLEIDVPLHTNLVKFVHRKLVELEEWFLFKHEPKLFGFPMVLCIKNGSMTQSALYEAIWSQVRRFTFLPLDVDNVWKVDDAEIFPPFELKRVDDSGKVCSRCSWDEACSGCVIDYSDEEVKFSNDEQIAIDWRTGFVSRYLSQDKVTEVINHPSVEEARDIMNQTVTIDKCIERWGESEKLEEKVYCSACKREEDAEKQMSLWTLPPVLVLHLQRLQSDGKIYNFVDFPFTDFNPWHHLKEGPKKRPPTFYPESEEEEEEEGENETTTEKKEAEAVLDKEEELQDKDEPRGKEAKSENGQKENGEEKKEKDSKEKEGKADAVDVIMEEKREDQEKVKEEKREEKTKEGEKQEKAKSDERKRKSPRVAPEGKRTGDDEFDEPTKRGAVDGAGKRQAAEREPKKAKKTRLSPPKLTKRATLQLTPDELKLLVMDQKFDGDPPLYDLLGVVDHIGSGRGGHYISYCKVKDHLNENKKRWYVFDDSEVSPIKESKVRTNNAYLLFYVQQGFEGLDFLHDDLISRVEEQREEVDRIIPKRRDCSNCTIL